jgi:phytoene dehydrogenase-like protein
MIKTCRKYWTKEIADSIIQLKGIRFDNPQFSFTTTFDMMDFKKILKEHFRISQKTIDDFFATVKKMNYYDDDGMTTRQLFEKFFPGRKDVVRFLMEPITYANGSTLDDPAITYGIVFSNFMSKGVYIFQGGTDKLIGLMEEEMKKNGVDIAKKALVEKIIVEDGKVKGVVANGKPIRAGAVISNGNLLNTVFNMVGEEHFPQNFVEEARRVRLNNSSCQVYMGIRQGEKIDYVGDLLFTSTYPEFDSTAICAKNITSRTFSVYYPDIRPGSDHYGIVSSTNANYQDWANLSEEDYRRDKQHLIDDTLNALEKYIPGVGDKIDFTEAATPTTFKRYTLHAGGSSFGTKFEGLKISADLPEKIPGLFHTGSVGIIMSGWLGAVNYGVITSNNVEMYLSKL